MDWSTVSVRIKRIVPIRATFRAWITAHGLEGTLIADTYSPTTSGLNRKQTSTLTQLHVDHILLSGFLYRINKAATPNIPARSVQTSQRAQTTFWFSTTSTLRMVQTRVHSPAQGTLRVHRLRRDSHLPCYQLHQRYRKVQAYVQ